MSPDLDTTSNDIIASSYRDSDKSDDVMGYIVENRVLTAALAEVLKGISNVEIQRGVKVKEVQRPDSQVYHAHEIVDLRLLLSSITVLLF